MGRIGPLQPLEPLFAICRLPADAPTPSWAQKGGLSCITRTRDELSIVCEQRLVPEGISGQRDWRALRVPGPLDFALTGVLAKLTAPLAEADISIFALSTFDTDYLLVRDADFDAAITLLANV